MKRGLVVDLFAGGGGASQGIEAAIGRPVDIAINHSATAIAVHKANHPWTQHLTTDIWEVKPKDATAASPVASCGPAPTARTSAWPRAASRGSKASAHWRGPSCAGRVTCGRAVIFLENVAEFRGWGPLTSEGKPDKGRMGETFRRWRRELERLGYVVDFRDPGRVAVRRTDPPPPAVLDRPLRRPADRVAEPDARHRAAPVRTAAECIDWSSALPVDLRAQEAARREDALAHRAGHPPLRAGGPVAVHRRRTPPHHGPDQSYGERVWPAAALPGPAPAARHGRRPGPEARSGLGLPGEALRRGTTGSLSTAKPIDTITAQDHHAL
jgi:hypothetical protein